MDLVSNFKKTKNLKMGLGAGGFTSLNIYLPQFLSSRNPPLSSSLSLSLHAALSLFPQCLVLPESHNCCRRPSLISLSPEFASHGRRNSPLTVVGIHTCCFSPLPEFASVASPKFASSTLSCAQQSKTLIS